MSVFITDAYTIVQTAGETYVGDGTDQVYSINPNLIQAGDVVTIIDQGGSNTIELNANLNISSSIVVNNELQLTLSNGAVVNVRNADIFTFNVGQNLAGGDTVGTEKTFTEFAQDILGVTVPAQGEASAQGGTSTVNDDGTADVGSTTGGVDTSSLSVVNNGLGTTSTSSTHGVNTLDSGTHWGAAKTTITYSFNTSIPDSYNDYGTELTTNWAALSSSQQATVQTIMDEIDDLLNITFQEVATDGDIRYNIVDTEEGVSGFSFYPAESPDYGGDVFLSTNFNTTPDSYGMEPGEQGWATIVHEMGHAVGLKHPFEGTYTLSQSEDDITHSIMSYTNAHGNIYEFSNTPSGGASYQQKELAPQLFSLFDVEALQSIYGVNTAENTQDNVYTYLYTDFALVTLWDAGGTDTIDISSGQGYSVIDLNGGTLNSVDTYNLSQVTSYYQNTISGYQDWVASTLSSDTGLYMGEKNLGIPEGVIIENVNTGDQNDTVYDNFVDNVINLGGGDDTLYAGRGGFDTVDGGSGNDKLILSTNQADVEVTYAADSGRYTLQTDNYGISMIGIESVLFSDTVTGVDPSTLV